VPQLKQESHLVALTLHIVHLPGALASLLVVLGIWVLSSLSLLEATDNSFYDRIVGSIPQPDSARHDVLLVETKPLVTHDWALITTRLLAAGARQIVFVSALTDDEQDRLLSRQNYSRILIGHPLVSPKSVSHIQPNALRDDRDDNTLFGVLAMPTGEGGIYRDQWAVYRVGPQLLPTIEKRAVMSIGGAEPTGRFLLNFHRGWELPRVDVGRFEKELPLPELVRGKTVMIGYAASPYLAQFNAPGLPEGRLLTQLEFHGLATDTLLQDKEVVSVGMIGKGLLFLAYSLVLVIMFQPLRMNTAFWVICVFGGVLIGVTWLLLSYFDLWLPVTELILITLLIFGVVYRAKAKADDDRLRQLFVDASNKLENRVPLADFSESQEHWIHVANFVDQVLQLDRMILLERVVDDHRVKEIQSLRCTIRDIDELRRDYLRFPYTEAIKQRGLIEIDINRRPFLKVKFSTERQFLAPLTFGNETFGFWAFALTSEISEFQRFKAMADNIAEQIGHLLYQRQIAMQRSSLENQPWRRYLGDDTLHLYKKMSWAVTALERRVTSLEQMFSGLSTAAIVFDLFGRVTLINDLMAQYLRGSGISPFEMTVADFIEKLTGRSSEEVRHTMQTLLTDSSPLLLPASLPGKDKARFMLFVRSLQQGAEEIVEASPFRIPGLLLELIDGAEMHHLHRMKSELVQHLNHQLNNDLATVLGANQLMSMDPQSQVEMRAVIETQGRSAANTITRIQDLLNQDINVDYGGTFPVDPHEAIKSVIDRLQPKACEREIEFDVQLQMTPFLVYANPRLLEDTLATLFEFLLDSAAERTSIVMSVTVHLDRTEFNFNNRGFGLPQERLDKILEDSAESSNGNFEKLRLCLRRITTWGGKAKALSALETGYVLSIQLRTF